jgi:hypothetical protein
MTDVSNVKICNLELVINFNVAKNAEFQLQRERLFCHAQEDKAFEMIMLVSEEDAFLAPKLVQIFEETDRTVPQMLHQMAQKRHESTKLIKKQFHCKKADHQNKILR